MVIALLVLIVIMIVVATLVICSVVERIGAAVLSVLSQMALKAEHSRMSTPADTRSMGRVPDLEVMAQARQRAQVKEPPL